MNIGTYDKITVSYVETREIGDIIGAKDLILFLSNRIKKMSAHKACQLLDACEDLEPILDGIAPRKWRRVS